MQNGVKLRMNSSVNIKMLMRAWILSLIWRTISYWYSYAIFKKFFFLDFFFGDTFRDNNHNPCYLTCWKGCQQLLAYHDIAYIIIARLRSFISSVILPSSLSYVPCTVLKFRALDRFPGINVPGIFYSRNFLNWVLTALFHPLANV